MKKSEMDSRFRGNDRGDCRISLTMTDVMLFAWCGQISRLRPAPIRRVQHQKNSADTVLLLDNWCGAPLEMTMLDDFWRIFDSFNTKATPPTGGGAFGTE